MRGGGGRSRSRDCFGGKRGLLLAVPRSNGDVRARSEAFVARPPAVSLTEEARETPEFVVTVPRRGAEQVRILVERALVEREFGERFTQAIPPPPALHGPRASPDT